MTKETRRRSIAEFETRIELPHTYFSKGDQHLRFAYKIDGTFNYIVAATPIEVAKLLHRSGKIATYATIGQTVHMYTKSIVTTVGRKGEPVLSERMTPCTLEDIDFAPNEVVRLAAVDYYEQAKRKMGGKLISMFQKSSKQTA